MYADPTPAFLARRTARLTTSAAPNASGWPDCPPDVDDVALGWAAQMRDRLRHEPGHFLLDLRQAEAPMDDDGLCWRAWAATTQVLRPIPQYSSGELVFPVQVVEGRAASVSHYSTTDVHGQYHTDGTLLPQPPDVAILYALEAADAGGETVLIDTRPLVKHLLDRHPALAEALMRDLPYLVHGQSGSGRVKWQPVLRRTNSSLGFTYLRLYIEQGFEELGRRMPDEVRQGLDVIDAWCAQPDHQQRFHLSRGLYLAWDNARFLHGRTPFVQAERRRRLRRIYGCQVE